MVDHLVYGLDIETGYSIGATSARPARAGTGTAAAAVDQYTTPIVRAVVSTAAGDLVFDGDERALLRRLDAALADLGAGILATWNGSGFDLPYLADRAELLGVRLGLHLAADPRLRIRETILPGHHSGYRAAWHDHRHLDAARLYRSDRRPLIDVEEILRTVGWNPRGRSTTRAGSGRPCDGEITHDATHAHAANDARLVRCLVESRLPGVARRVDRITIPSTTATMPARIARVPSRTAARSITLAPMHPAVRAALASGRP